MHLQVQLVVVHSEVVAISPRLFCGPSATTEAEKGRPDGHGAELAADEVDDLAVLFTCLVGELLCECLMIVVCFGSHTPNNSKNQWSKGALLNVDDSLIICALLLRLVLLQYGSNGHVGLRRGVRISHSHIKVRVLASSPESSGTDIQSCVCTCVCTSW